MLATVSGTKIRFVFLTVMWVLDDSLFGTTFGKKYKKIYYIEEHKYKTMST